jgi:hypothetical protein
VTSSKIAEVTAAANALGAAAGSAPAIAVPGAPGATPSPGAAGGTCERARVCCEKILAKSGNANSALNCNAIAQLPEVSCTQMLGAYTRMAAAIGESCQ